MKKPSERLDSSLVGRLLVVPRRSPAYDEACASSSRPRVDFNISHTDGAVVAAISIFGRIGVDIERRREGGVEEYLAAFTERERAWILAGVPAERMLRLWTRKEAILKAAGTGFLIPPSGIDVLEGGAIIEGARYSARELDTDFGSLPSGKRLGTGGGSDLAQDEDAGIFRCHLAVERADYHVLRKGDANGMLPEELLRDEIELRYVSPEEAVENLRARKRSRV